MPYSDEMQRFDVLLGAMVNKLPLETTAPDVAEEDLGHDEAE